MTLTLTDYAAVIALAVSSGAFALEIRRWIETGVRLKLTIMADAIEFPETDGKSKLALTVTNFGTMPTTITHVVAHSHKTPLHRLVRKPSKSFIVRPDTMQPIPYKLDVASYWLGSANYNDELSELRRSGKLSVGVICTHRRRSLLIKVPKEKPAIKELSPS